MRRRTIGGISYVLLVLICNLCYAESGQIPISEAKTLLAIYTDDWGLMSSGGRKLIMCVWEDGRVVWSKDRLEGGAPYMSAKIDPKRLESLLSRLQADGLFEKDVVRLNNVGFDCEFTCIEVAYKGDRITLTSWHELKEAKGDRVVPPYGVTEIKGKKLFEALKDEPSEYLLFRMIWSDIRARSAELIPTEGNPSNGRVIMKHGVMSWDQEDSDMSNTKQSLLDLERPPEGDPHSSGLKGTR